MFTLTFNNIVILLFILIIILIINLNNKISKNNKENFALTPDDLTAVRSEINRIYDMDVEAIRNLGAISKSLLTGTNTFTTSTTGKPGELTIPADNIIMQKDLTVNGTTKINGTTNINGTTKINGDLIVNGSILLPPGMIMAWYQETPPSGWGLCDGARYGNIQSPDLRGRFILGFGYEYPLNRRDGSATHTLTVPEMPAHSHGNVFRHISGDVYGIDFSARWNGFDNQASTGNTGNNQPHNNMPPYHVLVYVIKI